MLRWAGRIAAGIGVALLVLLCVLAGAAYITARPADPMLWPPRAGDGTIEIVVVSNGYHMGVALPRAALAEFASGRGYPALIAVTQRFAAFEWIEFGWGDREFYRRCRPSATCRSRSRCARCSHPEIPRCCMWSASPAIRYAHSPRPKSCACRSRATASTRCWRSSMRHSFRRKGARCPDLGRGLYGPSLFYPANGTFSIFRRLQSLDRRPARRRRVADRAGARDLAVRPDVRLCAGAPGLRPGAAADRCRYIFTVADLHHRLHVGVVCDVGHDRLRMRPKGLLKRLDRVEMQVADRRVGRGRAGAAAGEALFDRTGNLTRVQLSLWRPHTCASYAKIRRQQIGGYRQCGRDDARPRAA